jgi:hypothetical protein
MSWNVKSKIFEIFWNFLIDILINGMSWNVKLKRFEIIEIVSNVFK